MMTRLSTGIAGLDEILHGGLLPGQVYLVKGRPGAGKTTLALQFLLEGDPSGRAGTLRHAERVGGGAQGRRRRARLGPGRPEDPGDPPRRRGPLPREPVLGLPPRRRRARPDHPQDHRGDGAAKADPRGLRQPDRGPIAEPGFGPLSSAGPGPEGVPPVAGGDDPVPRRERPSRARRRGRDDRPRHHRPGAGAGARRDGPPLAPRREVSRQRLHGGPARGADRPRGPGGLPSPGRPPAGAGVRARGAVRAGSPGWTGCSAGAWTAAPAR